MIKPTKLSPFKHFCVTIGEIPSSYLESMTYYELLNWFCDYLQNTVIPAVNTNAEAVEEIQILFTQLKNYVDNYFDNLDVQEEINNKLDAMAESGQLTDIIAQYLGLAGIIAFDTVADMKLAENLVNGSKCKTLGFHSLNDDGGAYYKIRQVTNDDVIDEKTIIAVYDDLLVAELIIDNVMCVNQFGAYGDGEHDDQDAINTAVSSSAGTIIFSNNKTYMVRGYEIGQTEGGTTGLTATTGIVIPSNKIVDLNESKIKCITNGRQNYNIITIAEKSNIIVKNGTLEGDRKSHTAETGEWGYGVSIRYSNNITLENLKCIECWGDGININNNGNITTLCKNIYIKNCICDGNRRQGMSIENGENIYINDSQFINTGNDSYYKTPAGGVDIEPLSNQFIKNVVFDNCIFNNNYGAGFIVVGKKDDEDVCHVQGLKLNNSLISNNTGTYANAGVSILIVEDLKIENTTIKNNTISTFALRPFNDFVINNSQFINTNVVLYGGYMNYAIGKFTNNYFYNEVALPYNGLIDTADSPAGTYYGDGHNTLEIINNNFINKVDVNVQQSIRCTASARFNKLIAKNNIIKYGVFGIRNQCGCIIDGNNFIAQQSPAIYLGQGTAYDVNDIRNNVLEETAYKNQYAGAIYNTNYHNNLILQHNVLYQNCLNIGDQVTKTYSCNNFLQNTSITGISLNENNNIFDNSITE